MVRECLRPRACADGGDVVEGGVGGAEGVVVLGQAREGTAQHDGPDVIRDGVGDDGDGGREQGAGAVVGLDGDRTTAATGTLST